MRDPIRTTATLIFHAPSIRFADWLYRQLEARSHHPTPPAQKNRYETRFYADINAYRVQFSVADNPQQPNGILLFLLVPHTIGFWQTLLGKPDPGRREIIRYIHDILSAATEIEALQWYRSKQTWRGGQAQP